MVEGQEVTESTDEVSSLSLSFFLTRNVAHSDCRFSALPRLTRMPTLRNLPLPTPLLPTKLIHFLSFFFSLSFFLSSLVFFFFFRIPSLSNPLTLTLLQIYLPYLAHLVKRKRIEREILRLRRFQNRNSSLFLSLFTILPAHVYLERYPRLISRATKVLADSSSVHLDFARDPESTLFIPICSSSYLTSSSIRRYLTR